MSNVLKFCRFSSVAVILLFQPILSSHGTLRAIAPLLLHRFLSFSFGAEKNAAKFRPLKSRATRTNAQFCILRRVWNHYSHLQSHLTIFCNAKLQVKTDSRTNLSLSDNNETLFSSLYLLINVEQKKSYPTHPALASSFREQVFCQNPRTPATLPLAPAAKNIPCSDKRTAYSLSQCASCKTPLSRSGTSPHLREPQRHHWRNVSWLLRLLVVLRA